MRYSFFLSLIFCVSIISADEHITVERAILSRSSTMQLSKIRNAYTYISKNDLTPETRSCSCAPEIISFRAAIDTGGTLPPNASAVAGPNHLVIALNNRFIVQNKKGNTVFASSLDNFWAPLGNPKTCNPNIVYDPYGEHWVVVACTKSPTPALVLGISATTDPTETWHVYSINMNDNSVMPCQPCVGFNKNWITLQANLLNNDDKSFNRTHIYAIDKQTAYTNQEIIYTLFASSDIGDSQVPAQTYDNCIDEQYLLQNWRNNGVNRGFLRLYAITGAAQTPELNTISFPYCPELWACTGPVINKGFAPQKGTNLRIMCDDAHIQNVIFRNGSIWAAHTIFLPVDDPTRSAIQWWQLDTKGVLLQRGRIDDPGATAYNNKSFYAFPSIAVNQYNDVVIGYSRFSSNCFVSAGLVYHLATDLLGDTSIPVVLQTGRARYTKEYGTGEIHCGNNSSTSIDPSNDTDFWTLQTYAETLVATTCRWGLQWGHVIMQNDT